MNGKGKLALQCVICLGLLAFMGVGGSNLAGDGAEESTIGRLENLLMEKLNQHYTLQQVKEWGEETAASLVSVPAQVSQVVLEANEKGQYGKAIDEDSDDPIKPVHAVAGGKVLRAGVGREKGLYIMVEHQEKISTYGQLCDLTVVTGERIKKGDILGSYDSSCKEEFYFTLEDKN